jgi:hypothetical protein
MALSYLVSWFLNVVIIAIVLAWIDNAKGNYMERKPEVLFAISIGLPTAIEVVSYFELGAPFLSILLP